MSAIPSWCRVGAKCAAVPKDSAPDDGRWAPTVKSGTVVTITRVWNLRTVGVVIQVAELPSRSPDGREIAYELRHFRPLITLEDDIATHFRQHLDVREPVGA